MPVYRRLDRAGWQPVTHAAVTKDGAWIERFGAKPPNLYFTLYNSMTEPAQVSIDIDRHALGVPAAAPLREIVEDRLVSDLSAPITLPPHSLRVIQVAN